MGGLLFLPGERLSIQGPMSGQSTPHGRPLSTAPAAAAPSSVPPGRQDLWVLIILLIHSCLGLASLGMPTPCPSHEGPHYSSGSSRTVSSLMARQLALSGIPVSWMPLGNQPLAPFVWGATPPYLEFCSDLGLFDCARSVALWMPPNLGRTETLSVSAKPGWRMTLGPNEENIGPGKR